MKKLLSSKAISKIIQRVIENDTHRFKRLIKGRNPSASSASGDIVKDGSDEVIVTISKSTKDCHDNSLERSNLSLQIGNIRIIIHDGEAV